MGEYLTTGGLSRSAAVRRAGAGPLTGAAFACLAVLGLSACSNNPGPAPVPSEQQIMESLPGGEGATDMTPDAPPE